MVLLCARSVSDSASDAEDDLARLAEYQATVPKLSLAERARTLASTASFGVLSTLAKDTAYPSGSVTEFASDDRGSLCFALSSLAAHKQDLLADAKCSVTIMQPDFQGMQDARVTISGRAVQVPDEEADQVRSAYLKKHPNSFWVDFGDFDWFRLDASSIVKVRMVGGFGAAGSVSPDAYRNSSPDPVAAFSAPVCGHMNRDHAESTAAMVKHYAGIEVDSAQMVSLDQHGINVVATRGQDRFSLRLGYPDGPVTDRKAIKDAIVEMSKASS
jgi:putative heme iron utilization protein